MMRLIGLVLTVLFYSSAIAQENSPYSRYGLGDLTPDHNILTRGMGGISAAYADFQSVNFINPASYSNITSSVFDVGVEADIRTLKSISPAEKFSATNVAPSYLQLGFPIRMKKANKKGIFWGANIGLKPVSKINYKIQKLGRLSGIDSFSTIYEGSGGVNQVYLGTGVRIKNFSIGFNAGYMFGNKDYSTNLAFINDTVKYYQSNSASQTHFGGVFFNAGMQFEKRLNNRAILRVGVYGNLQQKMSASQDIIRETITYDTYGNKYTVDSVYSNNVTGKVVYPATYGFGFTYQDSSYHWLVGADFETSNWKNYRFYEQADQLQNSWKLRVGAEYLPAKATTQLKKYFNFVRYRAGFYYGPDYVRVGNNMPEYGITFGAGFPLKLRKYAYDFQNSILNTSVEIGSRGDKHSNLRENIIRIGVGFSLSDLWFRGVKYN